uniref:Uncharacterized protein n=1 Tax=viral metagenome TaxID=1070528 RepID=A0A6C0CA36_9ZZZZ
MLNKDIDGSIFYLLPISDKRSFLRICKTINLLSINMPAIESEFQTLIKETNFLDKHNYQLYNSLYKYTVELLFDNYDIPDKYIIIENRILYQYPKIYKKLAEKGKYDLIKKMCDRNEYRECNFIDVMNGAAKAGNIQMLQEIADEEYCFYPQVMIYAIKGNQLATLKWLANKCDMDPNAMNYAAKIGNIDVIDYLVYEHKFRITSGAFFYAAKNNHFDVVKYLHSIDPNNMYAVCEGAGVSGNLDILKFAYQHGHKINGFFSCGHTHMFVWLYDNNHIKPSLNLSKETAQTGNLECLQFLHTRGFPVLHEKVFKRSVIGENIEMVKWLYSMGCPFDETAVRAAMCIKSSLFPILKLLIEWKCPLFDNICAFAAFVGNLEMLKYLYATGNNLDSKVISAAATYGHLHIIIWCREQNCHWDITACRNTVEYDHLNVLKWLRGVDRKTCGLKSNETEICPWNEQVCLNAIKEGYIDILEFAVKNGCPFGINSYSSIDEHTNLKIAAFVRKNYQK